MNPTDNTIVRVRLDETDDSGKRQRLTLKGRKREQLGGEHKLQREQFYGLSTHAPKGSIGVVIIVGGNPSQALVTGIEHPDSRPKDLPEGEVIVYDDQGQMVHLQRDRILIKTPFDVIIETDGDTIIKTGGICHINP